MEEKLEGVTEHGGCPVGDERENVSAHVSLEKHECVGHEEVVASGAGFQDNHEGGCHAHGRQGGGRGGGGGGGGEGGLLWGRE